jgi:hypothetical protein
MNQFEYVMIPIGIICGLAIANLLGGVGKTVYRLSGRGSRIQTSWVHATWVLNIAFWIFAYWWYQFSLSELQVWTLGGYLSSLVFPVVLYVQSVILVPHRFDEIEDIGEYFLDTRIWFFGLLLLANGADILDGLFASGLEYLSGLGASLFVVVAGAVIASVVGMLTKNLRVHLVMGLLFFAAQVWQMFNDHPFLGARIPGG